MCVERAKRQFKIVRLQHAQAEETKVSASQVRREARAPLGQEVSHSKARWTSAAPTERHTGNDHQLNF